MKGRWSGGGFRTLSGRGFANPEDMPIGRPEVVAFKPPFARPFTRWNESLGATAQTLLILQFVDGQGLQRTGATPWVPEYWPSHPGRRRVESCQGHHESLAVPTMTIFYVCWFRPRNGPGVTTSP
jgi:hypothetical protein